MLSFFSPLSFPPKELGFLLPCLIPHHAEPLPVAEVPSPEEAEPAPEAQGQQSSCFSTLRATAQGKLVVSWFPVLQAEVAHKWHSSCSELSHHFLQGPVPSPMLSEPSVSAAVRAWTDLACFRVTFITFTLGFCP